MKIIITIMVLGLCLITSAISNTLPRNEIARYTLLNDKLIVDRELFTKKHSSFFELDLSISSGIKKLISDVSDSTKNTTTQVEKELNIYKLMSKNINTEKFVKIRADLAIPLPYVKIKNLKFLPTVFYSIDYGVSLSFSNTSNALNPIAQIYIKKDKKIGVHSLMKIGKSDELFDISLYRLERADIYTQSTKSTIATKGKLFNFDDLSKKHVMWASDISYKKRNGLSNYQIEVQELQLLSSSSTTLKSLYGTSPLIHLSFYRTFKNLNFYIGHHYRKRYTLLDGFYLATKYKSTTLPTLLTAKISSEFLTLVPEFKAKYFHILYQLKTPYRNPIDDMWVSAIHTLHLSFPFF